MYIWKSFGLHQITRHISDYHLQISGKAFFLWITSPSSKTGGENLLQSVISLVIISFIEKVLLQVSDPI